MACILKNARVIDGRGDVFDDVFLAIEDGRIREIGANRELPATARVPLIDLAGRTVMPGLFMSTSR